MQVSKVLLSALSLATTITASAEAHLHPSEVLMRRNVVDTDVLTTGGWALAINSTSGCPGGNSVAGTNFCCPTILEESPENSGAGAHACCPDGLSTMS
jgi:hypothetical protein